MIDTDEISGVEREDRPASVDSSLLQNSVAVLLSREDSARAVFLAWEGLRLVYNGVLTFLTVTLAFAFGVFDADLLASAFIGAVIANVCFCAGSCAEGYLALFNIDRRIARGLVFLAGLSLTSLAALVVTYAKWYDLNVP